MVTFICRPLNFVSLKWYRVNTEQEKIELNTDTKYVVSFYRRKLTIRNPGVEDTGVYECEAIYDSLNGGTVQSVSAQANLTIFGKKLQEPKNRKASKF